MCEVVAQAAARWVAPTRTERTPPAAAAAAAAGGAARGAEAVRASRATILAEGRGNTGRLGSAANAGDPGLQRTRLLGGTGGTY